MAKRSKSKPARRTKTKRRKTKRSKSVSRKTTSTATRTKKSIVSSSSANAHHAVRINPFSNATSQPKIPDGLVASSLSRRLQTVTAVTNGNGVLGNDIMHILMFPTLGVPIIIGNTAEGKILRPDSGVNPSYVGFSGQTLSSIITAPFLTTPLSTATILANYTYNLVQNAQFATWRIVSQGLRLQLTNNDEQNEGWFEACRFNWRRNNDDLNITQIDGSAGLSTEFGVGPSPEALVYASTIAMTEQPGYQVGLLKDIKKFDFNLHPKSSTHDPVEMDRRITLRESTDFKEEALTKNFSLSESSNAANEVKKSYFDDNMDCMYIRLHCRPNNGSTSMGSSFMLNLAQNVEMSFSPDSDFATFQTPNQLDKKFATVADFLNNNFNAGTSRRE